MKKVTFGFVNCNRLFYLKSCIESLLYCNEYENTEIIIVDNASIESGTDEYLKQCEDKGIRIFKTEERDPKNEFAKALNTIARESTGDYVCACPADIQFVIKGDWLKHYVDFYERYHDIVGCILIDAQRTSRNNGNRYGDVVGDDFRFIFNESRAPISPVLNSFISKEKLMKMYPWNENSGSHEGGESAEAQMVLKIQELHKQNDYSWKAVQPIASPTITIYNESGDNAKIRDNKIYGNYFEPKHSFRYYLIWNYEDIQPMIKEHDVRVPIGIEQFAKPIGWELPKDENGNFLKKSYDLSTTPYRIIE